MRVVLGRDGRELFLRRAEGLHVQPRETGIDIHEHAVGLGRFRPLRFLDPGAQIGQTPRDFFPGYKPDKIKGLMS